jgi:hypothetical protein
MFGNQYQFTYRALPCRSSGGQSASHRGGPGSSPGKVMWDLRRTNRQWGRFSSSMRLPLQLIPLTASHSSSSIIRGWYNRPNSGRRTKWTVSHHPKTNKKKTNSIVLSPRANYTDRATAACRRKWLPTFAVRGCHVVSVTDPYGCILGFVDRSRYFSIK